MATTIPTQGALLSITSAKRTGRISNGEFRRRRPLSVRQGTEEAHASFEALREDVPPRLRASLLEWVAGQLGQRSQRTRRWQARRATVRSLERHVDLSLEWGLGESPETLMTRVMEALESDPEKLLDATDHLVGAVSDPADPPAQSLERILIEGGSAWTVGRLEDDGVGLVRRVDETAANQAQVVTTPEDRASTLLAEAWGSVYGRHPNPTHGYNQAVRAVEALLVPLVTPNDREGHYGRAIGQLRVEASDGQWTFTLGHRRDAAAPVATIVSMLDLLWSSQHARHVPMDEGAPLHVTPEEAETAVHLAVTLVQWLREGALQHE